MEGARAPILQDDQEAFPIGSLIFDADGNLCGTTQGDSNKTFGSVFEITPYLASAGRIGD
jgi:hypothetical protein